MNQDRIRAGVTTSDAEHDDWYSYASSLSHEDFLEMERLFRDRPFRERLGTAIYLWGRVLRGRTSLLIAWLATKELWS